MYKYMWLCAAAVGILASCHITESLRDCTQDRQCEPGHRCNLGGSFCERDTGPVLIGAVLPLTGELGDVGENLSRALELAAININRAGGVLGRPIQFVILDDETSVKKSEQHVRQLIERRVAAIIGPLTSEQALRTQNLTFEAKILHISPTAGAEDLSSAQPADNRYFFRTISSARRGSAAAMSLFASVGPKGLKSCKNMAVVHTDDTVGKTYKRALEELFVKVGGCLSIAISVPRGQIVGYKSQVQELVAHKPDCAALVAFPEAGVEIVAEFLEQTKAQPGWEDFFWMGTTSLRSQKFLDASTLHPENPADGLFGGDEDTRPATREYRELRENYNLHFALPTGTDLPIFVSNTYDAAMLAALAIEHAGSATDRVKIRDGLWAVSGNNQAYGPLDYGQATAALARRDAIHYKGASSALLFDTFGTVSARAEIWKISQNRFEVVKHYSETEIETLVDGDGFTSLHCGAQ